MLNSLIIAAVIVFVRWKKTSGKSLVGLNEILTENMFFNPSTITISAGTTIKWTNKDRVSHNVTSDTGLFDSGNMSSNGTYGYTFSTAGTFPYHCTVHPSMKATIIVN